MTNSEVELICSLIKVKYSGKTIGDVFPGIQSPNTKFDDLIFVRGGLGTNIVTLIWPRDVGMLIYRKQHSEFEFSNCGVFLKDHIDLNDFDEID